MLFDVGLSDSPFCQFCPDQVDDVAHRCYCCNHTEHLWTALPSKIVREARATDVVSRLMFDRGLFPSDASDLGRPSASHDYYFDPAEESATFAFK